MGEDVAKDMNEPDESLAILINAKALRRQKAKGRQPMGFLHHYVRVVDLVGNPPLPFLPDLKDVYGILSAVIHRFGREMPPVKHDRAKDFESFAKAFIVRHIRPVNVERVPSLQKWLDESEKYSDRQREVLLKSIIDCHFNKDGKGNWTESFLKNENLKGIKYPRGINSYEDFVKCLYGPVFSAIDEVTFSTETRAGRLFVKGTQPCSWPVMMLKRFGARPVCETDFTSFEAHHRDVYAHVIVFWMCHMTRGLQMTNFHRRLFAILVKGNNISRFGCVTASIPERLMSGAMWTSSANSILNCLIMLYMFAQTNVPEADVDAKVKYAWDHFNGVFEGDDGLFEAKEDFPEELIAEMGLLLKLKKHPNYGAAGFCSIYCPLGADRDEVVVDPIKFMRSFFVVPPKYKDGRLYLDFMRAKAMSACVLYGQAPVVGACVRAVLRLTRGRNVRDSVMSEYKRSHYVQYYDQALAEKPWHKPYSPTIDQREVLSSMMGDELRVDAQIRMERQFDQWDCGAPLRLDVTHLLEAIDDVGLRRLGGAGEPLPRHHIPIVLREIVVRGQLPVGPIAPDGVQMKRDETPDRHLIHARSIIRRRSIFLKEFIHRSVDWDGVRM